MGTTPENVVRILISGASGTIGSALIRRAQPGTLTASLTRPGRPPAAAAMQWDPDAGRIDLEAIRRFGPTHVVHLAGENVFGRWSKRKKERIYASRVAGTKLLAEAAASLEVRPEAFLSASAVGYYGDRGDERLPESAPPGEGFLAEVCRAWEAAAAPAERAGVRLVRLRIGVVLDRSSGALAAMLPAYRLGLGGPIAGGRTWIPWITLEDAVSAVVHVLRTPSVSGPVNVVAPAPVTQREFSQTLARRLRRPALLPVPRSLLTLGLGEFARETVLKSVRAEPAVLLGSGFRFAHPMLDTALAALL